MKQAKWIRGVVAVLAVALVSSCGKKNNGDSGVAGINSGLYYNGGVVAGSNCLATGYGTQGVSIGINFQAASLSLDNVLIRAGGGFGTLSLGGPGPTNYLNVRKVSRFAELNMSVIPRSCPTYSPSGSNPCAINPGYLPDTYTPISADASGSLVLSQLAVQEILLYSGLGYNNQYNPYNQQGSIYNQGLCIVGMIQLYLPRSGEYGGVADLQLSNGQFYRVQF